MNALLELVQKGGPVMIPIIGLSVVLYARCFDLLFGLHRTRRRLDREIRTCRESLPTVRRLQGELQETYRQQRLTIGAMITAAPLLGLLGTVSGMVSTFDSLAMRMGQRSMEGLAGGISEVLICTESGLGVAIPAVMLLYYAHRQMQKQIHRLSQLEGEIMEAR